MKHFKRRFLLYLWPYYFIGFAALIGTTYITLEIPKLAKAIVNMVGGTSLDPDKLRHLAVVIILLGLGQIVIRTLSRIFIFWPGRQMEMSVKSFLFEKLMQLQESFYVRFTLGDLISRIANDVGNIRVFYAFGMLQILNLLLLLVFAIGNMLSIHVSLTLAVLAPLAIMIGISRGIMPKMHQYFQENQQIIGRLTNKVTEAYVNVHVIKANAAEKTFLERADVENEEIYKINIKLLILRMFFWPLLDTTHNLSILVALFYGGYLVINGQISIGDILAFSLYATLLAFPLTAIGIVLGIYPRSVSSLKRLADVDNEPIESTMSAAEPLNDPRTPLLSVKGLNFSHTADRRVLQNVCFDLAPNQRIGIYGPVGSGKSTLFNLITRLLEPGEGMIYFEGRDIRSLEPQVLRRSIGYVEQNAQLLSMSVRENVLLGIGREVSEDDINAALKAAQIFEEIMDFPEAMATQIGEKGVRLSGGQKQRLALARFFLRKPQLLILDDTLSAVDHSTESSLISHIYETKSAALIASHRVSALRQCDRVMVLGEDGTVLAFDTYTVIQKKFAHIFVEDDDEEAVIETEGGDNGST